MKYKPFQAHFINLLGENGQLHNKVLIFWNMLAAYIKLSGKQLFRWFYESKLSLYSF